MSLFNRMRVTQVQILINRLMIIRPIFRFFNQDLPLTDIHSQGSVTPEAMSRITKFSWTCSFEQRVHKFSPGAYRAVC